MSRLWPLSPAQEAIWFEEQIQRGTGNTGFFSVTLLGDLDEAHVVSACQAIVSRHAPIRTVVRVVADQPFLEVLPPTEPVRYERVDVPCAPGEEVATTISWRDQGGKQRFDLRHEPSIAFALLRHGPGRHTLLVVAHHLCYDGRSKFVFAREFAAALTELRAGQPLRPTPAPWPIWPSVDDQACERAAQYWRSVDIATFPPLRLPRARPAGTAGTIGERGIDASTRQRLLALAAANGTNLFGALLATLAVTLYGYGNTRMVVCVPVDVTTPLTRGLISMGVNVVPVMLTVDDTDTFVSTLAKAGTARGHVKQLRLVPFQRLSVGKAWPAGSRALFNRVALSYLRMATDVPAVPGLACRWNFLGHNSAQTFDLMLHLRDAYDRIALRVDFSGALDAVAATAVTDHLGAVLAQVLAAPSVPLRALTLLPAQSVVRARSAPTRAARAPHPLAAICAQQAVRHPDRPAVVGPTGSVSYRELVHLSRPRALDPSGSGLASLVAMSRGPRPAGWPSGPDPAAPCGQPAAALGWLARTLDLGSADVRTLQLAEPGSAEFWQECWLTWSAGGTLYLLGAQVTGAGVARALREHAITTMVAPYHVLRSVAGTAATSSLRDVLTPMARLRPAAEIVALVRAGVRLHAQYSTAGLGVVAIQTCQLADLRPGYAPVLRQLVDGIRISVCDRVGRILPLGVTGRLVLRAPASGLRQAPGDLGEVGRGGFIRFHGAAEETVEWAGQSLNIPGVERHLAAHPLVDDAVVVVRDHRPVAYLVPRPGADFDLRQARLHLRQRVIPGEPRVSHVRVVPALPRRPDGDVDRQAVLGQEWDASTRSWRVR